ESATAEYAQAVGEVPEFQDHTTDKAAQGDGSDGVEVPCGRTRGTDPDDELVMEGLREAEAVHPRSGVPRDGEGVKQRYTLRDDTNARPRLLVEYPGVFCENAGKSTLSFAQGNMNNRSKGLRFLVTRGTRQHVDGAQASTSKGVITMRSLAFLFS